MAVLLTCEWCPPPWGGGLTPRTQRLWGPSPRPQLWNVSQGPGARDQGPGTRGPGAWGRGPGGLGLGTRGPGAWGWGPGTRGPGGLGPGSGDQGAGGLGLGLGAWGWGWGPGLLPSEARFAGGSRMSSPGELPLKCHAGLCLYLNQSERQ